VSTPVLFAVANLLNLEVDVLLFDTTSTYSRPQSDQGEDGTGGFRPGGSTR
jgi:hypothetical protein